VGVSTQFAAEADDYAVIGVGVIIMCCIQVPYLIFHIWWVNKHAFGPEPSLRYKTASEQIKNVPPCKWKGKTLYERFELGAWWTEYVTCLPFYLASQGTWFDHPKSKYPGFCGIYGPMFANYSGISRFAAFYGGFLLSKTVLLILLIGTTIKTKKLASTNPGIDAEVQLWLLVILHAFQELFLITQLPFSDHIENLVQMIVTFQQGTFFAIIAWNVSSEKEVDGSFLNNVNMVGMTVLMINAMRGPIFAMRGQIVKAKKRLRKLQAAWRWLRAKECCVKLCGPVTPIKIESPLTQSPLFQLPPSLECFAFFAQDYPSPSEEEVEKLVGEGFQKFNRDYPLVLRGGEGWQAYEAAQLQRSAYGECPPQGIVHCTTWDDVEAAGGWQALAKALQDELMISEVDDEEGTQETDGCIKGVHLRNRRTLKKVQTYVWNASVLRGVGPYARATLLCEGMRTSIYSRGRRMLAMCLEACARRCPEACDGLLEELGEVVAARLQITLDAFSASLCKVAEEQGLIWPPSSMAAITAWGSALKRVPAVPEDKVRKAILAVDSVKHAQRVPVVTLQAISPDELHWAAQRAVHGDVEHNEMQKGDVTANAKGTEQSVEDTMAELEAAILEVPPEEGQGVSEEALHPGEGAHSKGEGGAGSGNGSTANGSDAAMSIEVEKDEGTWMEEGPNATQAGQLGGVEIAMEHGQEGQDEPQAEVEAALGVEMVKLESYHGGVPDASPPALSLESLLQLCPEEILICEDYHRVLGDVFAEVLLEAAGWLMPLLHGAVPTDVAAASDSTTAAHFDGISETMGYPELDCDGVDEVASLCQGLLEAWRWGLEEQHCQLRADMLGQQPLDSLVPCPLQASLAPLAKAYQMPSTPRQSLKDLLGGLLCSRFAIPLSGLFGDQAAEKALCGMAVLHVNQSAETLAFEAQVPRQLEEQRQVVDFITSLVAHRRRREWQHVESQGFLQLLCCIQDAVRERSEEAILASSDPDGHEKVGEICDDAAPAVGVVPPRLSPRHEPGAAYEVLHGIVSSPRNTPIRHDSSALKARLDTCLAQAVADLGCEGEGPLKDLQGDAGFLEDLARWTAEATERALAEATQPSHDFTSPEQPECDRKDKYSTHVLERYANVNDPDIAREMLESIILFFDRYDVDESGTLNSTGELNQLTINLLYNYRTQMRITEVSELEVLCKQKNISYENTMNLGDYIQWFKAELYRYPNELE